MNKSDEKVKWEMKPETFYKLIVEVGKWIDPRSASVIKETTDVSDPYGIHSNANYCIGRMLFAANPHNGIFVAFADLPTETVKALHLRLERGDFDDDDLIF